MPPPDGPVVVTGAGGYLGGRVVTKLGDAARALVRVPVPWLPASAQQVCDLLGQPADIDSVFSGAAAVVHLAGHNEVIARDEPARATDETEAMARAVLHAARRAGVRRLVYVSTVHVYGTQLRSGAVIGEHLDPAPTSPYAEARWSCERILRESDEIEVVVLRLTNAVGAPVDPGVDRWTLVANDLCRQAVLGQSMALHSSGQQWRDFIALADASRITVGALDHEVVAPGTYNLGSGRPTTIRSLAEMVQDRVHQACGRRPTLVAPPITDPPDEPYRVDVGTLGDLGLAAEWTLEDGVDEIVAHCIEHETRLRNGC